MTKKVFALDTQPGIQRDGTVFDMNFYTDGRWVRFQRGRPRKVGGYRQITDRLAGPSRGLYLNPQPNFNYVYSGYSDGLQVLPITNNGTGAGVSDYTLSNFTVSVNNLWQFDSFFDTTGSGAEQLVAHPGQNLSDIANTTNTPVLIGNITGTTMQKIGVFTATATTVNASTNVTLSAANTKIAIGQTVTGAGIPSSTTVSNYFSSSYGSIGTVLINNVGSAYTNGTFTGVAIVSSSGSGGLATVVVSAGSISSVTVTAIGSNYIAGNSFTLPSLAGGTGFLGTISTLAVVTSTVETVVLSAAATAGATVTLTFDNNISVSGGVVVLHPYVFVYGNNGLIKNCAAGDPTDWNGATANETNVSSSKVVQALPVRGGSNSPSGMFWSLDSLIRVSYAPTNITSGGVTTTLYWRYDIISSQSSILSSQSVIEYDGIYYWCGVDRFLMYNGVVKEIPNNMNQNYFYDNLNYAQRQKVYVTKVPRYGEIWWFYPRGSATECNDAIIYNIREQTWYDAGTALGARRSAGYFSQVFHFPLNVGHELQAVGGINTTQIDNAGSAYTNGTYTNIALTGGSGTGAYATIVVAGGVVTTVTITAHGVNYVVNNALSATLPVGSGFVLLVKTVMNFVSLWQHEIGTDSIQNSSVNAIESYFQTNDLGWVGGGPAQPNPVGDNRWTHLERAEPDFIQAGDMEMYVTGRPFAQGDDVTTGPYVFTPTTGKIDLREQRRELRLTFRSNVAGGDYQLGKLILSADMGDVRPYSNG